MSIAYAVKKLVGVGAKQFCYTLFQIPEDFSGCYTDRFKTCHERLAEVDVRIAQADNPIVEGLIK